MFSKRVLFLIPQVFLLISIFQPAFAGGIAPGATRVIYSESARQTSLAVRNSDDRQRYLIQAWVDDDKRALVREFIVTPPLFTAGPKSENELRIVYTGKPLPQDREVAYWMNVKAIPAVNRDAISGKNTLQLAVLSRVKLFMRPVGLRMSEMESMKYLRFRNSGSHLTVINPTPYYQSLVNISVGGVKVKNNMVPPMGQLDISLPAGVSGEIRFQTVNDYGALSAQTIGRIQ